MYRLHTKSRRVTARVTKHHFYEHGRVKLTIDRHAYHLTPEEALTLADQLVDTAEQITQPQPGAKTCPDSPAPAADAANYPKQTSAPTANATNSDGNPPPQPENQPPHQNNEDTTTNGENCPYSPVNGNHSAPTAEPQTTYRPTTAPKPGDGKQKANPYDSKTSMLCVPPATANEERHAATQSNGENPNE